MDAPPAGSLYGARLAELRAEHRALDARLARISSLRGVTFLAAVGLGAARVFSPVPPVVWMGAIVAAVAFVALVIAHAALVTRMSEVELRTRLCERGEKRIAGDLAALPDKGERFLVPGHAYAGDLDVFGPASLYQLVGTAETGAGQEALASWLAAPASAAEIAERQEAVRELATLNRFREDLAVCGVASGTRGKATEPFLSWAEASTMGVTPGAAPGSAPQPPGTGPTPAFLGLAAVLVTLTVAAVILPGVLGIAGGRLLWLVPVALQSLLLMRGRAENEAILAPAASREKPFGRYVQLFRLIEGQRFSAARLVRLHAAFHGTPSASGALDGLQTILGFAELRNSGLIAIVANRFLLWDVFCAAALARWRARSGASVRRWIEAMGELEALSGLATFAHEHPDFAFPEVSGSDLRFIAEGLGHPLIAAPRRVSNDVTLAAAGQALLVTGSNMSGKSTLLRAMGVNAVLALAGAPVCARRLSMAECQVRSSMRIKDSLEEGVSHFYAELERLKGIVDAANAGERVLFLLNEVLHGTNSRERNIGAKAVVVHLLAKGAFGAVSSHDLGLADLEAETGGRVKNVHFQELVEGSKMTFDYRLKPGVVTSSNALRLMKLIGIEVELPEA